MQTNVSHIQNICFWTLLTDISTLSGRSTQTIRILSWLFFFNWFKKMYLYKQPLFHEASWLLTLQAQWHQGFPSVFKAMCSGTTTLQTFYVSLLQHTWFPGEDWQDTGLETHDLKLNFVVVWAILLFLYWHVKVDMNDLGQRELKSVIVLWETDMTFRFGDHFA